MCLRPIGEFGPVLVEIKIRNFEFGSDQYIDY